MRGSEPCPPTDPVPTPKPVAQAAGFFLLALPSLVNTLQHSHLVSLAGAPQLATSTTGWGMECHPAFFIHWRIT